MKILVINGSNLNMLGKRPIDIYGSMTLAEINELIKERASGNTVDFYQSNVEGFIVDKIQEAVGIYDAIIINPGAYTHTSIAIRDALEIFNGIKLEVHLSDINNREPFRAINYIKDKCDKSFIGKGYLSYIEAIDYLLTNSIK